MKLRTNKSISKRIVKITKSGKVMRNKMSAQHLVSGKSKRAKKTTDRKVEFNKTDLARIKNFVPYLKG